tara:strand:- start:134 stop:568 length:435 start_codon:yes stop_codon:yes gene_type:complete
MAYKGKYIPTNPHKYIGNHRNVVYRSLWERRFMVYCDTTDKIVKWASEEVTIKYISPLDKRWHKYYPDFYVELTNQKGITKQYLIEIKPKKQLKKPKQPSRKSKSFIWESREYVKNMSKWEAAERFCNHKGWIFKVLTEDHLLL